MKRPLIALAIVSLICGATMTLVAESQPASTKAMPSDSQLDARINELIDMPPAERRAYLRSLDREERKGLWWKVKKTQADRRGAVPLERGRLPEPHPVDVPRSNKPQRKAHAVGTIAYDSGFPSVGFGGDAVVGNRFNTHTGIPVHASGTVSTVQAVVVPGPGFSQTTSNAGFVLLGPQTTMGGALAIFSTFTTASGVIDTVSFTGLGVTYTGSSFFVLFGDFSSSYIPVFGTGTTLGQGHHGVVGYTGGMGPDITSTFDFGGTLNAFVRATGNIVPVELMSFDIE